MEPLVSPVLANLLPSHSGKKVRPSYNAQVGDMCNCMVKTPIKFGKGKFNICQVIKVFPDEHSHVRSVQVEMRPTNNKEAVSNNVQVGDMCMVKTPTKFGKGKFKICWVIKSPP